MNSEYLYHSGDDLAVVNAAKISFANRSTSLGEKEIRLINYLARGLPEAEFNQLISDLVSSTDQSFIEETVQTLRHMATHWSPFTHTSITLRMKAPVPIRTQCFKHKVGFNENEESRRYISDRPELFIPEYFRAKAANVKQGSGGKHESSDHWLLNYERICTSAINAYEEMIKAGIAPEQARFVLPQGVQVNWVWTGSLAAYARYYNQRSDSHAQKESQDLSELVRNNIEPLFPVSWKALTT